MPPQVTARMGTGQRIAIWRNYRGLTQEACAGLVGKSLSWWKKVEGGTRRVEKLADLVLVAQVLKVRDLADLTGSLEFSLALDRRRETELIPPVRAAMHEAIRPGALSRPDVEQIGLSERVDAAMSAFHAQVGFVTAVGRLLPGLIIDATAHHRTNPGREPAVLLSRVYLLACLWLRQVSSYDLALTAVDRSATYGHLAADPLSIALSGWQLSGALKDSGRAEEGLDIALAAADELSPHLDSADVRIRATYGHIQLQVGLMAAHCQDQGTAFRYWDRAVELAPSVPDGYVEPVTIFSQRHPAVFSIWMNIALGKHRSAIDAANRVDIHAIPSAHVRSLALLSLARGYAHKSDDVATFHILRQAEAESPETVAQSGHAREICREMMRRDRPIISRDLHTFAHRIGLFDEHPGQ